MFRKFLYIFGFLVFILAIVPLFVDLSDYAAPYLKDAEKAIGRTIKTGSMHLQILPTPRLKVSNVVVGNASNGSVPDMIKIKNVEVILSLTNLLKGNLVVKSVDIDKPEVNLEKFKNGEGNWNLKINQTSSESKQKNTESVNVAAAGFIVKHLNISDALVNYIDHNTGAKKNFSNLNIESITEELLGPYTVRIRMGSGSDSLDVELLTGIISLNNKTHIQANIFFNNKKIHSKLDGAVDINKQQFDAKFTASLIDIPLVIDLPNQKIDLHKAIDIKGEICASPDIVVVKNLNINHPIGQLIGALSYRNNSLSADLKFSHQQDSIDLHAGTADFEEFEYQINSVKYQEILKWFTNNKLFKGDINIKGKFKSNDSLLIFKKTNLQVGDASAEADIQFDTLTKETIVQSKSQNIEKWIKLLGNDLPFLGQAAINLKMTPEKDGSKVVTEININKGNIIFEGKLGDEGQAKGALNIEHFNFNDLNIDLKSDIQIKSKEINLAIHKLVEKKSGLSVGGKIMVDLSQEKPNIVGSINAQEIKFASYKNEQVYFANTLYNPEIFKFQLLHFVANTNSRWSSEPINLPLTLFNLTLKVSVPKITVIDIILQNLQSELTLINGKLSIPFSAYMYDGKINGGLFIAGNEPSFSVKLDNVSIGKIPQAAAHFKSGNVSGIIDLKTKGNSLHDFVKNLQGQAQFDIAKGIVKGFDLHKIVNALKSPKNLLDLKLLNGETAFSKANGKFQIKNGVAETNDLTVETADAVLKVKGTIDILNWLLNLNGEVLVNGMKDLPPLKFTVKGPVDQPNYNFDLKQLIQKGAGNLVSKVIGAIVPGTGKNDEASNSNQPAAKIDKVVGNLIKGIFG